MKKFFGILMFFLTIILVVSFIGISFRNDETNNNSQQVEFTMYGKNVSILGDSISTFDGYSNDSDNTNSTIGGNLARYPQSDLGVSAVNQTWWKQVIDYYGANLLVNNSWRGTRVENSESSSAYFRCENLHDNTGVNSGTNPDIIFVYMGINDLGKSITCGEFNSVYDIKSGGAYKTADTFAEYYAIMIDKIVSKYSNADVFVFTLPHSTYNTAYSNDTLRLEYNKQIKNIARYYNLGVFDLANLIGYDNTEKFTNDGLHPNVLGMKQIADYCISILDKYYNL